MAEIFGTRPNSSSAERSRGVTRVELQYDIHGEGGGRVFGACGAARHTEARKTRLYQKEDFTAAARRALMQALLTLA